jgi:hypothetical protein
VALPPHSAAWVEELLGAPVPEERAAPCHECAMCAPAGEQLQPTQIVFDRRTKCCTYLPRLHNFLVGRILSDDSEASAKGRATVEARILAGVAVTPLGLLANDAYKLLYKHGRDRTFGMTLALRCPHYLEDEGGACGVWQHREATCATWFCKYERGVVAHRFWRAMHRLLVGVERSLAEWCVLELDPGRESLEALFPLPPAIEGSLSIEPGDLDGTVAPARYALEWGRWAGRELEYYRECARLVERLSWDDVLARCGAQARAHARLAEMAYGDLGPTELPDRLRVAPYQVAATGTEAAQIWTYSRYDLRAVPSALVAALPRFDARPTSEVVAELAKEAGLELEPELLGLLLEFGLLEPAQGA